MTANKLKDLGYRYMQYAAGGGPSGAYIGNWLAQERTPETPKRVSTTKVSKNLGKKLFPKQMPVARKRKYSGSPQNALGGRAAMKMQTKKLKSRRGKKVVVSKKLRKQVKQIMNGKELSGKYVVSRMGTIGVSNPTSQTPTVSIYGVATLPTHFQLWTQKSTWDYSSWFIPQKVDASTNDVTVNTNFNPHDAYTFFHPAKFIDAASVLWGGKAITPQGWLSQTQNITTRAAADGGMGDPNRVSNVRFHIVNSFVEFEIKNVSQRELKIRIINCTPRIKLASQYPLTTLVEGIAEDITENGIMAASQSDAYLNNPLFNPRDCAYFSGQYSYSLMEIVIKPGETCKHSIQGPKNVTWDSKNFLINKLEGEQYNMKGTQSCIFQVLPDVQVTDTNLAAGSFINTANSNVFKLPIVVNTIETFNLKCPESAGFITLTGAPSLGPTQLLNQKRRVTAYGNFASYNNGNLAFAGIDEEQPASSIAASLKF